MSMTLKQIAEAQERGEKIEVQDEPCGPWRTWQGTMWEAGWQFRIATEYPPIYHPVKEK